MSEQAFQMRYVRWWIADWAGSDRVADMELADRMVYAELLWLVARSGPFELDWKRLGRRLRCLPAEVEDAWSRISGMFDKTDDGRWTHERAEREFEDAQGRSEKARHAVAERERKRAEAKAAASPGSSRRSSRDASRSASPDPSLSTLNAHLSETQHSDSQQSEERAGARTGAEPPDPSPRSKRWSLKRDGPDLLADLPLPVVSIWGRWIRHQSELPARDRTRSKIETHASKVREVCQAAGEAAAVGLLDEALCGGWKGLPVQVVREWAEGSRSRQTQAQAAYGEKKTATEQARERNRASLAEWAKSHVTEVGETPERFRIL
jgi:hypothetical protein